METKKVTQKKAAPKKKADPKKETVRRADHSLKGIFLSRLFRSEEMDVVVRAAEELGFKAATYVDGRKRDNVKTVFLNKSRHTGMKWLFDKVIDYAGRSAPLFGIDVYPEKLEEIQVARYLPGDHYGSHIDHDSSLSNLEYDRKISFFVSCTPNGVLDIGGSIVNVNIGDAVVFPSTMHHAAPKQGSGTRYSFVAWIPGPPWK